MNAPVMQATKKRLYGAVALKAAARFGGQCRYLWNMMLAATVERYKADDRMTGSGWWRGGSS